MIEKLPESEGSALGVKITGKVSLEMEKEWISKIEKVIEEHGKVSVLADVIRHVSTQPGQDLQRLYRQMVFNVMLGNTDDHLKNFIMLHNDEGWRLSPAFDLVPKHWF